MHAWSQVDTLTSKIKPLLIAAPTCSSEVAVPLPQKLSWPRVLGGEGGEVTRAQVRIRKCPSSQVHVAALHALELSADLGPYMSWGCLLDRGSSMPWVCL